MTRGRLAVLLVAPLMLMLAARLPAAWLAPRVAAACGGRCALTDIEGTWRAGRARLVTLDGRGEAVPLLPLAWQWQPAALFGGALVWRLDAPATGELRLAAAGLSVRTAPVSLAAAALEPLLAGRLGLSRWDGTISVRAESLSCDWQGECRGGIDGEWRDVRFASAYADALGDYAFTFSRDAAAPWQGRVKALRGPLWLDVAAHAGRIAGEAHIDAPARAKLAPLVGGLAAFDAASGRYRIDLPLVLDGSAS